MDTRTRIGIQIRELRKAKGFTQDELAAMIERSTEALSNLERGVSLPGIDTLEKISEALGVPVQDFFQQERGKSSGRRIELMTRLLGMTSLLSDKQLALVVRQVQAIREEE